MSPTSDCSFCLLPKTLLHVVSGCNTYLSEGRYTWRHDPILNFLALSFQSVRDSIIYADLPGFINPSAITGNNLRPDLLLVLPNKWLYILELTVGFESNFRKNSRRQHTKYNYLTRQHEHLFSEVKYINLSVSALGVFDQLSQSFLEMLKDLNYNPSTRNYIIRKITNIAIRIRLGQSWIVVMLILNVYYFFSYILLVCIKVATCRLPYQVRSTVVF